MNEGFMVDHAHGGGRLQLQWVAGKPVRSFWQGLKIPKGAYVPVATYRCTRCGYLESYARPQ